MSATPIQTRARSLRPAKIGRAVRLALAHAGYDVNVQRRPRRGSQARYVDTFSLDSIFDYFRYWQTRFEISGRTYGGPTDYGTEDVSILQVPELYDHCNLQGASVLELGALECGNTLLLLERGAARVTALEGRVENYVKCCVVKNLFQMENVTIALDDVRNIAPDSYGNFDVALVAGVLYHLNDPQVLLDRLTRCADVAIISTHCATDEQPPSAAEDRELPPFGSYRGKSFREGTIGDVNSGLQSESFWPYEDELLRLIRDCGWANIRVLRRRQKLNKPYRSIHLLASK